MTVVISRHAAERMSEMGVGIEEVMRAVEHPEVAWTGTRHGRPETTAKRGRIAVAWHVGSRDGARIVKTVLWNTQDRYERSN